MDEEDGYVERYIAYPRISDPWNGYYCGLRPGVRFEMLVRPNARAPHKGEIEWLKLAE